MKKVFLICPVRNASEEASRRLRAYVEGLEAEGFSVHWPARDTDQDDPIGVRICLDNGLAVLAADEVHVWYDAASQGSVFDFGMLFMASQVMGRGKKIVIANPGDVPSTEGKSFQNVLLALAKESP